jgi:branched-chain amino acid transport system ATP-binding protein
MSEILNVKNLGITFGGLKAVQDVNLTIGKGEIVGLIGPNGAGKTTVFNMLTNVYQPTSGEIALEKVSIVGKKTYETTAQGIARTFQNIRLFKDISVIDNVKIAMDASIRCSLLDSILRLPRYWKAEREVDQRAHELLEVVGLGGLAEHTARNLPYGQQRKLEIARALGTNPKLLLLDEPAAGMNPTETQELMRTIRLIRDKFSISILLIEHDMSFVMGICERLYVLDYGMIIASGNPEEVRSDPRVIAAYLGGE